MNGISRHLKLDSWTSRSSDSLFVKDRQVVDSSVSLSFLCSSSCKNHHHPRHYLHHYYQIMIIIIDWHQLTNHRHFHYHPLLLLRHLNIQHHHHRHHKHCHHHRQQYHHLHILNRMTHWLTQQSKVINFGLPMVFPALYGIRSRSSSKTRRK